MTARQLVVALLIAPFAGAAAGAQAPARRDTLTLGALQRAAVAADPRAAQRALLREAGALRRQDIAQERLPALSASAQATAQSDVTAVPLTLPGGQRPPAAPRELYDLHAAARHSVVDPTRAPRLAVERARTAEAEARLDVALHAQRLQVTDAYFQALLAERRAALVAAHLVDLERRIVESQARVREGVALPSEAASLEAELLRRRTDLEATRAERLAALEVLGSLAGMAVDTGAALAVPALGDVSLDSSRLAPGRPEHAQFDRARATLRARQRVATAKTLPSVSAFARTGLGRPGLNVLGREWDEYWLVGVQAQWAPWHWGATRREQQALGVESRLLDAEEAAFEASLRRATARDRAAVAQLARALETDDHVIALRERIERETRARFAEGVVTPAEYLARRADLLDARLDRAMHEVELARARARLHTTLGLEIP